MLKLSKSEAYKLAEKRLKWKLVLRRKVTKADSIFRAELDGQLVYAGTDGTNPNQVDDIWPWYLLDVRHAAVHGIEICDDESRWPFRFPRPPIEGANPTTPMTGHLVLLLEDLALADGVIQQPFRLRLRNRTYAETGRLPRLEDIKV